MYEQFFQLERRPFAAMPDPDCFFRCESISHVLDQLTVCIEHGQGIGILTSPAGMGKTLICRRLVKDLGERVRMIFLGNSNFPTRRSLLQAILFEAGVEYPRKDEQELRHELRNVLRELRNDYESVVLIVDEAHSFEVELLEEIRTLVDLGDEGHSLVRVILSGQLELEERMTDRRFDAINQRISTHVYLEPLSIAESIGFLRHRIDWSGGNLEGVFSDDSATIIARASCGVPRCLNQLADHSLLLGFAADESLVQEATVREALDDLKQLPLHWNDVNDADRMIASQMEDDEAKVDKLSDEASEVEDVWEAETGAAAGSAEVAHDGPSDEHGSEHAVSEFYEAMAEDKAEAAPLAVFEFGADDIEDSPLNDHDEGDTLGEAGATIDVAEVSSGEAEAEATHEEPLEPAGQPSPPVSEISGVVLNLSSQVCGEDCTNAESSTHEKSSQQPHDEMIQQEAAPDALGTASSPFEMEVAFDPYAVIEEPLAASIVWGVTCEPKEHEAEAQKVLAEERAEADHVEGVCEVSHDSSLASEEVNEEVAEHTQSEEACQATETESVQPEEAAEWKEDVHDDSEIASQMELNEVADVPLSVAGSKESSEASMQGSCEEESDEGVELDVVEEPTAELSLFADGHCEEFSEEEAAEATPGPAREIHPDRYIDAIGPMLGEIDELYAREFKSGSPERDAFDIEAELVDVISRDEPDVENEIGITALDICLAAQQMIQQGGERAGELRESARPFAEAEAQLAPKGYDIVEPELPPEADFTSQVSTPGKRTVSAQISDGSLESRPFGRLFSNLRRRES